ncbi:uncharacterized protein LOC18042445 isoform X2 [Citrus clementina]|uniref:uncharacterized protein LOC18042445 isoform X2 n=1 Tax=Citrus clementina TaxID=85681 RepID=UPI000CED67AD|nr:uncharacterized protein LOC18042445 isoform X2 [Citrus x clementina]
MRKRTVYAWGVALICFIVLMIVTPAIPQSEEYHDFADQRKFFGIPNTLNVVSNFPFLVIGIVGLVLCFHGNYFNLRASFGGGHVSSLVWQRLALDLLTIILSPMMLVLCGTACLFFDDLRPYALVQFVPCIAIPLMAILLPPMYTHSTYWLWAAGFYLLAKVEEAMDKPIYRWTHHIVSGHTLKHLCAATVPVFLTLMLAKRTIETERVSLLKTWRIRWTRRKENDSKVVESYECTYTSVPVAESS